MFVFGDNRHGGAAVTEEYGFRITEFYKVMRIVISLRSDGLLMLFLPRINGGKYGRTAVFGFAVALAVSTGCIRRRARIMADAVFMFVAKRCIQIAKRFRNFQVDACTSVCRGLISLPASAVGAAESRIVGRGIPLIHTGCVRVPATGGNRRTQKEFGDIAFSVR